MHINLFVFNAILAIGCQKTSIDNPYDAPTTYTWTKQDLNDFSNELKQSEADLVTLLETKTWKHGINVSFLKSRKYSLQRLSLIQTHQVDSPK